MRSVTVKARDLCILLVLLFSSTIVACYALAIQPMWITKDFFTISLAFQYDPGRAIASFGLPLIGFVGYFIFLARVLFEPKMKDEDRKFSEMRLKWAHRCALFCPIGFIGVGALTLD